MMRFLAMGGYGSFVWSAYGASAVLLSAAVILTLRSYYRTVAQLRQMDAENQKSRM
jgi:heme exporter protein CcmD